MWVMATNANSGVYDVTKPETNKKIAINTDNVIDLYVCNIGFCCFCIRGDDVNGDLFSFGFFNTEEKAKKALDKILIGIMHKNSYCRIYDDIEGLGGNGNGE